MDKKAYDDFMKETNTEIQRVMQTPVSVPGTAGGSALPSENLELGRLFLDKLLKMARQSRGAVGMPRW